MGEGDKREMQKGMSHCRPLKETGRDTSEVEILDTVIEIGHAANQAHECDEPRLSPQAYGVKALRRGEGDDSRDCVDLTTSQQTPTVPPAFICSPRGTRRKNAVCL